MYKVGTKQEQSAPFVQEKSDHPQHRWRDRDRHPQRYGADHRKRRERLLAERVTCESCGVTKATILDHICAISVCGLSDDDADYQVLCAQCDRHKTSMEGHAARRQQRLARWLAVQPFLPFFEGELML